MTPAADSVTLEARANRDHSALALAVQPADGWRELWLDTLSAERQHSDPSQLGAFSRWGDVAWRRESLALR